MCDQGYLLCGGACRQCPAGSQFACDGNACAAAYSIGGTVTGLVGTIVLEHVGHGTHSVSAAGAFTLPTASLAGTAYEVRIQRQPNTQICTLANGKGTTGTANVTNIGVACTTGDPFEVDNTINAAEPLLVGVPAQVRNLSSSTDVDWVSISELAANKRYTVRVPSCTTPVEVMLYSYDSDNPARAVRMFASEGTALGFKATTASGGSLTQVFGNRAWAYYLLISSPTSQTGGYTLELVEGAAVTGVDLTIRLDYTDFRYESGWAEAKLLVNWTVSNNGSASFNGCFDVGAEAKTSIYGSSVSFYPDSYAIHGECATLAPGGTVSDYNYFAVNAAYVGTAFVYVDWDEEVSEFDETNNLSVGETWCSNTGSSGYCE